MRDPRDVRSADAFHIGSDDAPGPTRPATEYPRTSYDPTCASAPSSETYPTTATDGTIIRVDWNATDAIRADASVVSSANATAPEGTEENSGSADEDSGAASASGSSSASAAPPGVQWRFTDGASATTHR